MSARTSGSRRLLLKTLGLLELRNGVGDVLARNTKPLVLLALLGTRTSLTAPVSYLRELLWSDSDEARASASLRQALYTLRRLGVSVEQEGGFVRLDGTTVAFDLHVFNELLREGAFSEALGIYRGPFLSSAEEHVEGELGRMIEAENERLLVGLDAAFEGAVRTSLDRGEGTTAEALARRWVEMNPLLERATKALIVVLAESGENVEALRVFEHFKTLLDVELGDTPGPGLFTYVETLVNQDFPSRSASSSSDNRHFESRSDSAETRDEKGRDRRRTNEDLVGSFRSRFLIVAALVVSAATVVALTSDARFVRASVVLAASEEQATGRTRGELRLIRNGWRYEPDPALSSRTLTSPDGRFIARSVDVDGGLDLAVRTADGPERIIASDPHDERPASWSNDGRTLLYVRGGLDDSFLGYHLHIWAWSSVDDTRWPFSSAELPRDFGRPQWSPEGSRVATMIRRPNAPAVLGILDRQGFLEEEIEVGAGVSVLQWSPDGRRIAYQTVTPGSDVHIVEVGSGREVFASEGPADETQPRWLSASHLAYRATTRGQSYLVVTNLESGRLYWYSVPESIRFGAEPPRHHHDPRELDRLLERTAERILPSMAAAAVATVEVDIGNADLGVGEWTRVAAVVVDRDSVPVPFHTRVRLESSDTSVIAVREGQWVQAKAEGVASLSAIIPGVPSRAVPVNVRAFRRASPPVLLEERWTGLSIDTAQWAPFGSPSPSIAQGPGGTRGMRTNGDQNHHSGVVSHSTFPTAGGLTVEVEGSGEFDGGLFQVFGFGFLDASTVVDRLGRGGSWAEVQIDGPNGAGDVLLLRGGQSVYDSHVPEPPFSPMRRTYALQITDDGLTSLFVDGRRHVSRRTSWIPDSVRIVLAGREMRTDIHYGPIRLHRGALYTR